MYKLTVAVAMLMLVMAINGCDSSGKEADKALASFSQSMKCSWISGGYNQEVVNKYTGEKDRLNMIIESDCDVSYNTTHMGSGSGTLDKTPSGTYYGTVTSSYCPSGKAWVQISSNGYLSADCQ
jgi:hypothetical protein